LIPISSQPSCPTPISRQENKNSDTSRTGTGEWLLPRLPANAQPVAPPLLPLPLPDDEQGIISKHHHISFIHPQCVTETYKHTPFHQAREENESFVAFYLR
jgi:hypothetical protein